MPDIRIVREHGLGLARARQLAQQWADEAEQRLKLRCEIEEGRGEDIVRFTRPGVDGQVRVTAERFELEADLGFLYAAFSRTITREIESHLDGVLAALPPAPPAARKPAKAAKAAKGVPAKKRVAR